MRKLSSESEFNDLINGDKTTIVIFRAEWCPDCRFIDSFINEVSDKHSNEIITIEINSDEFSDIAQKYNVFGIPSFVSFKNGNELKRFVNRARKSRIEIENFYMESLA